MSGSIAAAKNVFQLSSRSSDQVNARFGAGPLHLLIDTIRQICLDDIRFMILFFRDMTVKVARKGSTSKRFSGMESPVHIILFLCCLWVCFWQPKVSKNGQGV